MPAALFPSIVNLELTNACNLACVFCDHARLKRSMAIRELDPELLKRILAELAEKNIYEIGLVGLGEPLLNPLFAEHLALIDRLAGEVQRISLNTNGVGLSRDFAGLILSSRINHITISLNAASRDAYKRLMGRDAFDKVVGNIKDFAAQLRNSGRRDFSANVQSVISTPEEKSTLESLFAREIDVLTLFCRDLYSKPALEGTEMADNAGPAPASRYPCWSLYSRIYIDVNGNVYPCTIGNDCYREKSNLCLGNVGLARVGEIFNNPSAAAARDLAEQGLSAFPECERCNIWALLPNNFALDAQGRRWLPAGNRLRLHEYDKNAAGESGTEQG